MNDITEIACESYKEDLRSYDNPDYVITYPEYDWRLSYVAYDAMLNELTDYHDLNQPDKDYETFGVEDNIEVISLVDEFKDDYHIFFINDGQYDCDAYHIKGLIKIYYAIIKINLC